MACYIRRKNKARTGSFTTSNLLAQNFYSGYTHFAPHEDMDFVFFIAKQENE